MADDLLDMLRKRGLLKPGVSPVGGSFPALCHAGALAGGLSVASDVRPDEALGPLAGLLGGSAVRLKVLDVRDAPRRELDLHLEGETWTERVPDVAALVAILNARVALRSGVRAVANLGEWDDMLQLWCLPKAELLLLLGDPRFRPENRSALERLVPRR